MIGEKLLILYSVLTELSVSFDSCNILSAFYWFSKYGELGFFIRPDKAAKDGAPERI